MAKRMMKLTVEEVRANIPYDLICMVRYGCTWSSGRRRRAAVPHGSQLDGRPGRSRYRADEPEDVPPVAEARRLLRVHLKGEASSWRTTLLKPFFHRRKRSTSS